MGCDGVLVLLTLVLSLFQFTQPKWAATTTRDDKERAKMVSIHAAQMGCDQRQLVWFKPCMVSIHAAQMGCDLLGGWTKLVIPCFNSRSPNGLRLFVGVVNRKSYCVSIHAAQMGCDLIV